MTRPKVVVTDYIEPDLDFEIEEMEKRGVEMVVHQLKFCPEEEVIEAVKDADVIVVNMVKITENVANALTRCKVVIRHGAGYDNVDANSLTKRGIPLAYVPDYCMDEVAEQAIALLFACARQVVSSRDVLNTSIEQQKWDFSGLKKSWRMSEQILGIVGCGRIGSHLYEKLRYFGFRDILVCDPYLSEERITELGIKIVSREEVFRNADLITVHTPLNDDTRHIVNAETLGMMKKTAFIVNTSRGPMVDHAALAEALRTGQIAGAGIDVYDKEPPEDTYPLLDMDNAVLTPHLAWYSEDAAWDIRKKIIEDIDLALAGKPPRFCVNEQVLEIFA